MVSLKENTNCSNKIKTKIKKKSNSREQCGNIFNFCLLL